jgi:hypothetical protein
MLYFANQFTHEQFNRIHQKALKSVEDISSLEKEKAWFLGHYQESKKEADLKQYKQRTAEIEKLRCYVTWLDYVNRWMTTLGITQLFASTFDMKEGEVTEFGLVQYSRPFDEYGSPIADDKIFKSQTGRKPPFQFNGAFINHGRHWSVHS